MYSDNKQIRDVADVAARIMSGQQPVTEKLHPNQQKLDVHEPEKDELTADDFKKLRAKKEVKKEEVEQVDENMLGQLRDRGNIATGQKQQDRKNFDTNTGAALKANSAISGIRARMQAGVHLAKKTTQEEVEQVDEANRESKKDFDDRQKRLSAAAAETAKDPERLKRMMKIPGYAAAMGLAKKTTTKEEVEQIVEYETNKDGKFVHNAKAGRYGGSEKPQDPFAGVRGPGQKDLAKIDAEKKKKKKFSEMVNLYQEKGLKSLSEMLVKEEPDNEQFTKELEDAKAKSEGKKRNTEIAKGSVQAVKQEELDINDINGVQMSTIEERMMTEPEKEKKEDIVKGMKKGMAGFKDRYGDRAKDVMYAAATKQAMK